MITMDEYNDCEIPITIIAKIQVTYYVFSIILFFVSENGGISIILIVWWWCKILLSICCLA